MGEMADMLIEQMEDALFDIHGIYDDDWAPEFYAKKKIPTCKYCGKKPLRWENVGGHWILYELNGCRHDCLTSLKTTLNQQKMNTPPFPSLTECPMAYDCKTGKAVLRQLLPIPSWDETFMHEVYWWARRSKDPRTKIGAVLVRPGDKDPISHGYNGFARDVNDNEIERWEKPEKYEWVVHAEDNAVLNCARKGQSSKGAIMFTQGVPCTRCTDACIQGDIIEIVVHKQWQDYEKQFGWEKWIQSAKRSEKKLKEAGIKVRVFDGVLGMQGVLDGKVISV